MPSTVYKGDLAEVTMGHESGLYIEDDHWGALVFTTSAGTGDSSIITFSGTSSHATGYLFDSSHRLLYPTNMLVGARLIVKGGGNFGDDDWEATGREYTIIANSLTTITVSPAMKYTGGSDTGDVLIIPAFSVPSPDVTNTSYAVGTSAKEAKESLLTDQFIGIAGTVGLPETKVDLKRYHVVGVGRDVVVQAPGKFTNEGGSLEVMVNNARWFYYCLGKMSSVPSHKALIEASNWYTTAPIASALDAGQIYIDTPDRTLKTTAGSTLAPGHYVYIRDGNAGSDANDVVGSNLLPIHQHKEVNLATAGDVTSSPSYFGSLHSANVPSHDAPHFDATGRSEIRRIAAIDTDNDRIYLDEPLCFSHKVSATTTTINDVSGYAIGETGAMTVDEGGSAGVALQHFAVGDTIFTANGAEIGVLTAVTDTQLTCGGGTRTAVANNDIIHLSAISFLEFRAAVANTTIKINNGGGYAVGETGAMTVDTTNPNTILAVGTTLYNASGGILGKVTVMASNSITIGGGLEIAVIDNQDLYWMRSPNITSDGELGDSVDHLIFSKDTIPSFSIETSLRSRDVGAYNQEDASNAPGSSTDAKILTRVFRGCKVKDWSLTADTDAAVKMSVNFDSAYCYTDTGRLEATASNRGDRLQAHRMFENTANTLEARKESGIAQYGQKPYFFYNGTLTVGGVAIAQVTNFTLSGSTGVTYHHTIRGTPAASSTGMTGAAGHVLSTEQVPFGGSRNASLAVEGKETFDLNMEVIVDDPIFWHHMRTTTEFNNAIGSNADGIVLKLHKQGAGTSRERMTIIIDDFFITEAPLPIPEDKGVIRSSLKIAPKHVRILATDTLYHY